MGVGPEVGCSMDTTSPPMTAVSSAVLVALASREMSFCTMAQLAAERASLSASLVVVSVSAEVRKAKEY